LTRGDEEAINLVAPSYGRAVLNSNDEIVLSVLEHEHRALARARSRGRGTPAPRAGARSADRDRAHRRDPADRRPGGVAEDQVERQDVRGVADVDRHRHAVAPEERHLAAPELRAVLDVVVPPGSA
jgi:hypothetical protein